MKQKVIYIIYSETFSSKEKKSQHEENLKNLILARVFKKDYFKIIFYRISDIPSKDDEIDKFFTETSPNIIFFLGLNAAIFSSKILIIRDLFNNKDVEFLFMKRIGCDNLISFAKEVKDVTKIVTSKNLSHNY